MRYLLLTFAVVLPTLLRAQGGSNYSTIGIGDFRPAIGALYDGASSYGIALPSTYTISTVNPALWTFVQTTRLQGGYRFHQQLITAGVGRRAQNNGKVEGLITLFAIDTAQGWSLSWGFYPLTSVNAAIAVPVAVPLPEEHLKGNYRFLTTGGISTMHLGLATRLTPSIGAGVAIRYHFGLFQTERTTTFQDSWTAPDTLTVTDWISGANLLLGIWYRPTPNWLFAASLTTPTTFTTDQIWRYAFVNTYGDSTIERSLRWRLPATFGFGIAYQWNRMSVAAEGFYADFQNLNYRLPTGTEFQALYRASLSLRREARAGGSRSYWNQLGLSAGVSWQRLYYRTAGHPISEAALSAGMSLPLGSAAILDIACQSGIRGKRAPRLVQEWFGRFTFTLSIGERWFIPSRRR